MLVSFNHNQFLSLLVTLFSQGCTCLLVFWWKRRLYKNFPLIFVGFLTSIDECVKLFRIISGKASIIIQGLVMNIVMVCQKGKLWEATLL